MRIGWMTCLSVTAMTTSEHEEIGRFLLGVKVYRNPDGSVSTGFDCANRHVPLEIVLTYVRAFLKDQEKKYFDGFSHDFLSFTKGEE